MDTFEEIKYGHLKLGVLSSTEILETCADTPPPSSLVASTEFSVAISTVSSDSV